MPSRKQRYGVQLRGNPGSTKGAAVCLRETVQLRLRFFVNNVFSPQIAPFLHEKYILSDGYYCVKTLQDIRG
jgi:hypothetical protein